MAPDINALHICVNGAALSHSWRLEKKQKKPAAIMCQGAIPLPQLNSQFLPAFTMPRSTHVYNVVAMVTKGTGRNWRPISHQLPRAQRQIV